MELRGQIEQYNEDQGNMAKQISDLEEKLVQKEEVSNSNAVKKRYIETETDHYLNKRSDDELVCAVVCSIAFLALGVLLLFLASFDIDRWHMEKHVAIMKCFEDEASRCAGNIDLLNIKFSNYSKIWRKENLGKIKDDIEFIQKRYRMILNRKKSK